LPALLTVEKEINVPRLKCLLGILQARDKSLQVWGAADLGVDLACVGAVGSPTRVADVYTVAMKRRAEVITGPPDDAATLLAEKLRVLGFLR
jgi:electron transfer flavoprotein beta subunit